MNLPNNTLIASEKLNRYLLIPKKRNDKSKWLAQAGYTVNNWQELERSLRLQILSLEAILIDHTQYGQMYEIRGDLTGPNNETLAVVAVWMTEVATGITKFITMYPDKGKKK